MQLSGYNRAARARTIVGYGCSARTTLQLWPRPATSATRTIVWLGAVLGWAGAHTWLSALPGSRLAPSLAEPANLVSPATRLGFGLGGYRLQGDSAASSTAERWAI